MTFPKPLSYARAIFANCMGMGPGTTLQHTIYIYIYIYTRYQAHSHVMYIYRNGPGDAAPRGVFGRAHARTSSFVHAVSAGPFSISLLAVRGEIGCCILTHGTGWDMRVRTREILAVRCCLYLRRDIDCEKISYFCCCILRRAFPRSLRYLFPPPPCVI